MSLIGITGNTEDIDVNVRRAYHEQVIKAGGTPVILPPVDDVRALTDMLSQLDGIIFTGGGDVNPLLCGEEPTPLVGHINDERDRSELLLAQMAYHRSIPMLGICRGVQVMAIALKGRVVQDISQLPLPQSSWQKPPQAPWLKHSQTAERDVKTHTVTIERGSLLAEVMHNVAQPTTDDGPLSLTVNSFHHQAVQETGPLFRAVAHSTDGVVEAMECTTHKSALAVQWHPEWLHDEGLPLFEWLVREADIFHHARRIHLTTLTLDTHNDNPMNINELEHFTTGNNAQVDLPKMVLGQQDATTMVAYLPQPHGRLDCSSARAWDAFVEAIREFDPDDKLHFSSPATFADAVFDKIEEQIAADPHHLSLARNRQELWNNKLNGRKSIMLGIENGLAIGTDISLLQHFKDRGIIYMTLCHNGDNLICDSASRTNNTHGGLSPFGIDVVKEMNRLGILVDMSHAGERSFYDALEASDAPIVCSHSNCRALCDHPRNLTDDQLRALARKGGVAHTTFYGGFLSSTGEATILDGIRHLDHAVHIMGIDHVGIGTDFDGGGGVTGMNDSSDMINFTLHLLRQRYNDDDIRKIWGGNWLRLVK